MDGLQIKNGDFIGFVGKSMYVSESNMNESAKGLLSHMLTEDKFMLTVFCGKAASEDECEALEQFVTETYPDMESFFIPGGQDVYPYIFIVE